jgi:SAM-dependent methyltransferase
MDTQAQWNERYLKNGTPWETERHDRNLERLIEAHSIKPCAALEIGCGTGNNAIWLAARGFQVKAVDVSAAAVDKARRKAQERKARVDFSVVNVLSDKLPGGQFGLVFDRGCLHCFEATNDRRIWVEAVYGSLADRGLWVSLIGSSDGPKSEVGPPRWSASEITAAVESRFEIIELAATHFDSDQADPPQAWSCLMRRRL